MSCNQLSQEALKMQKIVNNTQDIRNNAELEGHGISVAGAAAGLLVGTVTGGIGIAAAGMLAKHASDSEGDKAEDLQDIAYQRRSFIVGIFKAKKCMGPIEHTLLRPEQLPSPIEALSRIETASGEGEASPEISKQDSAGEISINGKQPPHITPSATQATTPASDGKATSAAQYNE